MGNKLRLFDDVKGTDADSFEYSMPRYTYLTRATHQRHLYIRELLQQWFDEFDAPTEKREKLAKDFRSERDEEHLGAFFELYLHHLFRCLGFGVFIEPPNANGEILWSKNNPDFLLTDKAGQRLLVEAASVFPEYEFGGEKQRFNELLDAINKDVNSPDFWIGIFSDNQSSVRPPYNKMAKFLKQKLSNLTVEEVNKHHSQFGEQYSIPWNSNGWDIEFRITNKNKARGNPNIRSLGLHSDGIKQIDVISDIQKTIKKKNSHYGKIGIPYILALNVHAHPDVLTMRDALLGLQIKNNGNIDRWLEDGVWCRRGAYPMRRMSGLCSFFQLTPDTMSIVNPILWHHPRPSYRFSANAWKFSQKVFNGKVLEYESVGGLPITEILDIEPELMAW